MPTTSVVVLLKIPLLFSLLSSSPNPLPFPPVPVIFHNFLTLLNVACLGLLPAAIPMHCGCFAVPGTQTGLWEALGHQSTSAPTAVVGPHGHHFLWVPPMVYHGPGYMSSAACARGGLLVRHLFGPPYPSAQQKWGGPGKEPGGWLLAVDEALYIVFLLSHGGPADPKSLGLLCRDWDTEDWGGMGCGGMGCDGKGWNGTAGHFMA